MKRLLTLLLFFISVYGFSQGDTPPASCITPKTCSYNLTMPIPAFVDSTVSTDRYYAKSCININSGPPTSMPLNFHKVTYAASDTGFYGCVGATADCSSDGSVLVYKAIYPKKSTITNFNVCKLPVVIFFHGGSFADCNGAYDGQDIQTIGKNFAERGFIFISVEYRKGVRVIDPNLYTVQQILAIWRAVQDARGVIRSIIKHEITTIAAQKETEFHIDTSKIFLAGNSAGAVIAMNVAYYTHQMVIDAFPPGINDDKVLGDIDPNFYYGGDGTAATGSINFTIKGVLDLWGGVLMPNPSMVSNPSAFFFKDGHTLPPTISFCGALDPTFPPVSKVLQFPSTTYTPSVLTESFCLNDPSGATSYSVLPAIYGNILGSQSIYGMLHNATNKVFSEFYLDSQMLHGLDADCMTCLGQYPRKKTMNGKCMLCSFKSDFGTGDMNTTQVNYYIVQRAAIFFQAVMNNAQWNTLSTTKFLECQNNRYGCSTADNNNSCPPD